MRMGFVCTFKYVLAVFQDSVECATCKDQKMVLYEPCWDHINSKVVVESQNIWKESRNMHHPLPITPYPFLRNKPCISQIALVLS